MIIEWEQQERGWYTSRLGGIYEETKGGWWFYPIDDAAPSGPFKTLGAAKRVASSTATSAVLLQERQSHE